MNITIKKAGIISSMFLKYEFEQQDSDVKNDIKTKSDAPIHDDLRNAYKLLTPHFVKLCELCNDEALIEDAIKRPELHLFDRENAVSDEFFKYNVHEISIENKKGLNLLTMYGTKNLSTHETISIDIPIVDLDGSSYIYCSQLNDVIDNIKEEVLAYMQGKYGAGNQLEMFADDEENEVDDDALAAEVTMKVVKDRKSKKQVAAEEKSAFVG
jgi:hypothetical protein